MFRRKLEVKEFDRSFSWEILKQAGLAFCQLAPSLCKMSIDDVHRRLGDNTLSIRQLDHATMWHIFGGVIRSLFKRRHYSVNKDLNSLRNKLSSRCAMSRTKMEWYASRRWPNMHGGAPSATTNRQEVIWRRKRGKSRYIHQEEKDRRGVTSPYSHDIISLDSATPDNKKPVNFINFKGETLEPMPHYEAIGIVARYMKYGLRMNLNYNGNKWVIARKNLIVLARAFEEIRYDSKLKHLKLFNFIHGVLSPPISLDIVCPYWLERTIPQILGPTQESSHNITVEAASVSTVYNLQSPLLSLTPLSSTINVTTNSTTFSKSCVSRDMINVMLGVLKCTEMVRLGYHSCP